MTQTISSDRQGKDPWAGMAARANSFARHLWRAAAVAALAVGCYFLISHFFVQSVRVTGFSMAPTLGDSDTYLLNRWIFRLRSPRPSEIVVLRDPADNGYSVKRVVAVSGDSVFLKEGEIFVNGRKLKESYLAAGTRTFTCQSVREQLFKCRANEYFVLGDNRKLSIDSRTYGPVPGNNILGLIVR